MPVQCNLCGSDRTSKKMDIQEYSLLCCENCDFYFLDPIPTHQELEKLYSPGYYSSLDSNQLGYTNYKEDVDLIILTAIQRYRLITSKIKPKSNFKLLDIGCAYGYYLDLARLYGWDVMGVELNPEAVREASEIFKLDIKPGRVHDHAFEDASFDLITCWDLVEHLQDPKAFFQENNRILKTGGSLVLTTPDISSLPSRVMGKRWMGYKTIEHIHFFSKETLSKYFEKTGFELKECCYIGKHISINLFIDRFKYYFGSLGFMTGGLRKVLPPYFYLNPFDILYVRAEKVARDR
jgi:2-polyprenyl-3-methyl-5-hydroxy-6-metoxy-1,4-benzoquinol methylase